MDLVKVQTHNVMSLETKDQPDKLKTSHLAKEYPDVFHGTGKLHRQYNFKT